MRIIFVSYWGIHEGLTQATVLPHIKILAEFKEVKQIKLFTVERASYEIMATNGKIEHIPLESRNYRNVILNKIFDFVLFQKIIVSTIRQEKTDLIICRSSLAGGIGYLASRQTGVPYVVESFEPHAQYMVESNVWKVYDPRYWIENFFQRIQQKSALYVLPVAQNYARFLASKGVASEKIIVVPCTVDLNLFSRRAKSEKRNELAIDINAVVGIYVGKFGGMYYDEEAYQIFMMAKKVFPKFALIILTPNEHDLICKKIKQVGFTSTEFRIFNVNHENVPDFLSAADFAFATYKPSFSKRFLSPIKVGEYWACGLPVFLTKGVGDDATIIESENCGVTFCFPLKYAEDAMLRLKQQLSEPGIAERAVALAKHYRSQQILVDAYKRIIGKLLAL